VQAFCLIRCGAHDLREGAVPGDHLGDRAADLGDALGELLAREDVFQFGDERGAGEEAEALLTGSGEYVRRCAASTDHVR
jgi:hypothetical protein